MSELVKLKQIDTPDIEQAIALEKRCYAPEAAATEEAFRFRAKHYGEFFWTAWSGERLIGITNGIRTCQTSCGDEMKGAQEDDAIGINFCVLTIAVDEHERGRGIGRLLLRKLLDQCRLAGIHTVILMCEEHLIPFYESEGFSYQGLSASQHGGIAWHEMSCLLHTMDHQT